MFVVDGTAQRILRGAAASLGWQPRDHQGEPGDPGGAVTVSVTSSSGATVVASIAATGAGAELRTVAVTSAQTAQLDVLFAEWSVAGVPVATTRHDIVGGFYYDAQQLRDAWPSLDVSPLGPAGGPPDVAEIVATRAYVETFLEQATGRSWVPRFDVCRLPGPRQGVLVLPRWNLRRVRWVKLWTSAGSGPESATLVSQTWVDAMPATLDGSIDFGQNLSCYDVEVGFEHGTDAPPADVLGQALVFARSHGNRQVRGLPDAATTQRLPDGGFVTLATPGVGQWHTGIPTVDDMIKRRARREVNVA